MNLLTPITLNGKFVSLVPLNLTHVSDLKKAVSDGELWKIWYTSVPSPENMEAEIKRRLTLHRQQTMLPFAVIDNNSQRAIGMTTYYKMDLINNRCDLGWTWYAKSYQRTSVNTESKLLLLTHAFERLKCIAVTFGANAYNVTSRRAIERLGAKLDGILRNYRVMDNGVICDYYHYSIINNEWPAVKTNLLNKLQTYSNDYLAN